MADANATLDALRHEGADRPTQTLTAPFDGIVATVPVAQGDRVQAGATLMTLTRLDGLVVTVGIDPGHNGGNFSDPGYLNQQIWNGRALEGCDTTGTETDSGYTEAQFNFNVATYLEAVPTPEELFILLHAHLPPELIYERELLICRL